MTNRIVIVGGGQAAAAFAAKLRSHGSDRPVTILSEEPVLPYQKPPLSKKYLTGEFTFDRLLLRPEAWYAANDVACHLGDRAVAVDPQGKTVTLASGETVAYGTLAFATGSVPRRLPAERGGALANVFAMRDKADADRLAGVFAPGRHLLVVGGGYVGLETAAVARKLGLEVTVVELADRILKRVAAAETAGLIRALHQANGVRILENTAIDRLVGDEAGRLAGALLGDGSRIDADVAVVGIGIRPADDLARAAGIAVGDGILVDEHARTSDPDIYAFGDCASQLFRGQRLRLESVQNAIDQAEAAASHLCGETGGYDPKPWFWSDQYDAKLQIAGLNLGYDDILTMDGPRPGSHAVWYFRQGEMLAVDALNFPAAFASAKKLLDMGRKISRTDIETRPLRDLIRD